MVWMLRVVVCLVLKSKEKRTYFDLLKHKALCIIFSYGMVKDCSYR
jgi:hypothetical protein